VWNWSKIYGDIFKVIFPHLSMNIRNDMFKIENANIFLDNEIVIAVLRLFSLSDGDY
jgi:hypothetical protein